MKRFFQNSRYLLLLTVLTVAVAACEKKPGGEEDGKMTFQLLDAQGSPVSGTQTFVFDAFKEYELKVENVASVSTERPEGWSVSTNIRDKKCKISAPASANPNAEASGNIVFTFKNKAGSEETYTIAVSAGEVELTFDVTDAPTSKIEFAYNQVRVYNFVASESFGDIAFETPKGWTGNYTAGETRFSITAPSKEADSDWDGKVSITPKSKRGESGAKITWDVTLIDATMPVLTLDSNNERFKFGTAVVVEFEQTDVAKIEVPAKPAGWNATVDLAGKKVTITPPANLDDEATDFGGKISLKAYNVSGSEDFVDEQEITVRLDGIATLADMNALKAEYAKEENPEFDPFMQNGEIVVLDDINLGLTVPDHITAKDFEQTFNGLGHQITINVNSSDNHFGGLFRKVKGHVKNLVVAGSMTTSKAAAWIGYGGVALEVVDGEMTNVISKVNYTFSPETYLLQKQGRYGGVVANVSGTGKLTKCEAAGITDMTNGVLAWTGGVVGYAQGNDTQIIDCVHSGTLKISGHETIAGQDTGLIGGICGYVYNNNAAGTFVNCKNTGKIEIDMKGTNKIRLRVGGILGRGFGSFTGCSNDGTIETTNQTAQYDYYGGILGEAGNGTEGDRKDLLFDNCHNNGTIKVCNNFTGGIVGGAEKCKTLVIKNCSNSATGKIISNQSSNRSGNSASAFVGGIVGFFKGNSIENCTNAGEISGDIKYAVAGISARSDNGPNGAASDVNNPIVVKNCHNTGVINTTTVYEGVDGSNYYPLVAGVIAIGAANEGSTHHYKLENCTNTGTITAEVTKKEAAQNVWVFNLKHRTANPAGVTDPTVVDAPTETSQANQAKMTITVKPVGE